MRVLLGINWLKFGIPSLGLRLCSLSLGNHIPDCERILGAIGLHRWLDLLTLVSPYWDFNIRKRGLDGGGLLKKRKKVRSKRKECWWNLSDVLWEESVPSFPQLEVSRDSCPVERFCPYLGAVVPAHSCNLFSQPRLRVQHPTFIRCNLRGLRSFPGHSSCILSFLQLNLKIQDQQSLGGQFYLGHMKLLVLVFDLGLQALQASLGT